MAQMSKIVWERMKAPRNAEYVTINEKGDLVDFINQLIVIRDLFELKAVWTVIDSCDESIWICYDGVEITTDKLVIDVMHVKDKKTSEIGESVTNHVRHSNAKKRKNKGITQIVEMANTNAKLSVTINEMDVIEMMEIYGLTVSTLKRQLVKVVSKWMIFKNAKKYIG